QEAIVEEQESRKEENIHLTRFLRVLANFLALCTLAGSGYLIFFVVRRSQKFALEGLENYGWWERNEVLQETFSFLSVERCGNRFVLTRTVLPKAVILAYAAIWKVVNICMFTFIVLLLFVLQKSTAKDTLYHRSKIWSSLYNGTIPENSTAPPIQVDPADVPRGPCWETMVGQEFVRLTVSDTMTTYITILIGDFLRAVFVRFFNYCWCWDLEYGFVS
ncbi:TMC1 protein, partial [Sula dactylatra]|nr:TMC1 protein [Sula dactylatra]